MSAKKITYLAIKEKLLALENVKHCLLFNSQFDNMDDENTFPFPCVFVEFLQLDYTAKALGTQEADARIRLHVGFESLKTEELAILDLLEAIQGTLQGFTDDATFSPLNRVFEGQDVNHDQVIVWLMDYETLITDTAGHRDNKLVETSLDDICIDVDTSTEATKPWLKQI